MPRRSSASANDLSRSRGTAACRGARPRVATAGSRPWAARVGARTSARATAFGADAYPSIHEKAGALLHSLARNHALADGNRRLALAATVAFYGLNGLRLTLSDDEAYDLVVSVATGGLEDVAAIGALLERGSAPRV